MYILEWSKPLKAFGFMHIFAIVLMLLALVGGIFLGVKFSYKKYGRKIDKVLGYLGLGFLALELYKQIFTIVVTGSFDVTKIPFQLCSTPLYLLLIFPLLKKGGIKEAFIGYIGYFSLTAAVFYFVKPTAALITPYVTITLQSFFWHIFLVGTGAFAITSYDLANKNKLSSFLGGFIIFVICVAISIVLNTLCNRFYPEAHANYFYININEEPFYPVFTLVFKSTRPYVIYVLGYIIYFSTGCFAFYGLARLANHLIEKKTNKQ